MYIVEVCTVRRVEVVIGMAAGCGRCISLTGTYAIKGGFFVPVSLVILVLYIVALFGISWYAKKRSEGNNENYALAGRKLSAPLICVTIIGLAVGGASTIGVSEHAFRLGLSAGWYTIAWSLGAIVMGLFMAKKYREQNITTITELIERHHDTKAVILGVFC